MGRTQVLLVAFQVQKQCDLCSKCCMLRTSSDEHTDKNVDQVRGPVLENRSITIYNVANYSCMGFVTQNMITNTSKSKTK
jgi:hypothetical protein